MLTGTKRILIKFQEIAPEKRAELLATSGGAVSIPPPIAAAFKPADLDRDKRLDKAELVRMLEGVPGGRDPERVMVACDTDGDGYVSEVEFCVNQMWFRHRDPEPEPLGIDEEAQDGKEL